MSADDSAERAETVQGDSPAPAANPFDNVVTLDDVAPADRMVVSLDGFEGPLDLLLHLIKRNEVNIYDIPITLITKQYLEYIDLMQELNLDVAGEFLVMAATLALRRGSTQPTGRSYAILLRAWSISTSRSAIRASTGWGCATTASS